MTNSILKRITGLAAAASTTLVLFSAVAGLADQDRDALALSKAGRTMLVANAAVSC
jgi:hypothetical protein